MTTSELDGVIKSLIVILDDEPARMDPWVRALQARFGSDRVRVFRGIRELFEWLDAGPPAPPGVFVLDAMLPPEPPYTGPETDWGMTTGIAVRRTLAERLPDVPAVLWTQSRDITPQLVNARPNDRFGRKRDVMPQALVEWVAEMLGDDTPVPAPARPVDFPEFAWAKRTWVGMAR